MGGGDSLKSSAGPEQGKFRISWRFSGGACKRFACQRLLKSPSYSAFMTSPSIQSDKIRNLAIVAHADHGKTTLVDQLLRHSGAFRDNQVLEERAMDSMDQERSRRDHDQGQEHLG